MCGGSVRLMADLLDPARHFAPEAFALFWARQEWRPSRAGPGCSKYPSVCIQADEWGPAPALFKDTSVITNVLLK